MARVIKLIALDYPVGYYAYSHVSLQEGGGEELRRHGGKEYKGGTEIEEKPALTMWAMSPQAKERRQLPETERRGSDPPLAPAANSAPRTPLQTSDLQIWDNIFLLF